jgi:hypothetical protein
MPVVQKLETPIMAALLASLAVFLITHALVVFALMMLCAIGVVVIALMRVVRT